MSHNHALHSVSLLYAAQIWVKCDLDDSERLGFIAEMVTILDVLFAVLIFIHVLFFEMPAILHVRSVQVLGLSLSNNEKGLTMKGLVKTGQ